MQDIVQLVQRAGRRLVVSRFLEATAVTAMIVGCLLLMLVVAAKSSPILVLHPWWLLGVGVGIVVLAAVVRSIGGGRDPLAVAIAIDERLGLKDRFSVAWQMQDRDDPFAIAAIEDAATIAREPSMRTRVARAFRPEAPRGWWASFLLLMAIVGVWTIVPQGDLFATEGEPDDIALVQTREEIKAEMQSLAAVLDDESLADTDLQATLEDLMGTSLEESPMEEASPEVMRREAIRQVSSLQERLEQLLDGDQARLDEQLQDALADLDTQGLEDQDSQELAEALANGDFEAAREAFEKMRARLEGEDGQSEDNQSMAGDLEKLAEEIERLASDQKALEDALRQAGMDPDLAGNKEALEQALQKAGQLNESQREALEKMMQSQGQAAETLRDLAKSMQQASQCNNPSASQQGQQGQQEQEGGESGSQMLSKLEQMQQMLQQARGAKQQCQNACEKMGSGLSDWASSLPSPPGSGSKPGQNPGAGMRGAGRGAGGEAPKAPTPTRTVDQREEVENRGGDVIAREFIEGEIVTGESRAKLRQISDRLSKGEEQGVADSKIPPHLRDVHRHYFGKVKKRLEEAAKKSGSASAGEEKPTPPPPKSE